MKSIKILLAFALLAAASSTPTSAPTSSSSELPKPSYARTMLKVSRSLPGETEELKVRTSEGNVATLIVKRREKSTDESATPSTTTTSTTSTTTTTTSAPAALASPTTAGYRSPPETWSRLQTWSSVDQDESKNWVPVSRGFDSWKPVEQPFSSPEPVKPTSWLVSDNLESSRSFQTIPADGDSNERIIRYTFLPQEPRSSVRTNIGANLLKNRDAKNVPAEVVIRSEINVKPQPGQPQLQAKRLPMTIDPDGIPVVHGRRVPDEPIDKIQVWRNARVINDKLVTDPSVVVPAPSTTLSTSGTLEPGQSFERFFEDVNRRYSNKPSEENSFKSKAYRNEVLAAEIYETAEDTYRPSIRKRMLQPEVAAIYPNSRLYSPPETQKSSASIVKPGTRAPVLQYAHPELGVQPAKIVKNEKRRIEESTELPRQQQQQQQYTSQQPQQQQQQQYHGEQRQKKKYVLNDKNIVDSYPYKNYYPNHFYGLKRPMTEPPFWYKISENLKNGFTDGVNKMSEFTKPVFDPLVEATRKISENLGLSSSRSQDPAQDKIGSVATSSSVLIPALGLVASGAALGIGAVAVGRYLDVDVLKRSQNGAAPLELTSEESQRALGIISELQREEAGKQAGFQEQADNANGVYILVQENGAGDVVTRTKRDSGSQEEDDARRLQRKGADEIAEIVEIDLPSRTADDAPIDEANDLRVENEEAIAKAIVEKTLEAIASSAQLKKSQPSEEAARTRRRRSLIDAELDDALQNLENAEIADVGNQHIPGDWTNTPCAKRIFCDAMVKRGNDAYMFMQKKMTGLLRMIQPGAAVQVSSHFDEVMEAVRRHDCSVFSCPQARPANVFF